MRAAVLLALMEDHALMDTLIIHRKPQVLVPLAYPLLSHHYTCH
jgi:hypothetical protein